MSTLWPRTEMLWVGSVKVVKVEGNYVKGGYVLTISVRG